MIEESYVSFDTAKLLKEAGFDAPCYVKYTDRGVQWDASYPENFNADDWGYSCPTQALAARWLREEHRIFIMLTPVIEGWMYDLFDLKKHQYILCNEDAMTESYEVAFETALREAIKLIKK